MISITNQQRYRSRDLALQPIDLIFLIGNQAGATRRRSRQVNDLTELEARIDFAFRLKRRSEDPNCDSSGRATIEFMSRDEFQARQVELFLNCFRCFETCESS